jgi:hypothetical protein
MARAVLDSLGRERELLTLGEKSYPMEETVVGF